VDDKLPPSALLPTPPHEVSKRIVNTRTVIEIVREACV